MAQPTQVRASKRKRTTISYADLDERTFDDLDGGDVDDGTTEIELPVDDDDEDDSTYGSKKKVKKVKTKKARWTPAKPIKPKESKTKPFRFLDLPAELRDQIYDLALVQPDGITVVSTTKALRRTVCRGVVYNNRRRIGYRRYGSDPEDIVSKPGQWRSLVPNLLAVSKQTRAEGVGYLYKQPIIFENTATVHTFIAAIGQFNRLVLSEIVVKAWGHGKGVNKAMNVSALTALAECPNLQRVHIDCEIDGWRNTPLSVARQLYRDGHYFFENFGAANGGKDAVVDVLELNDNNFHHPYNNASKKSPEENHEEFEGELRKLLLR